MPPDYKAQVDELMAHAHALDLGPTKVALLEEAVRLADTHGDVRLGFDARRELIQAANFSGFPEKSLVAFSWCLARCDRDPATFPDAGLLWMYKWVASGLTDYPRITRRQIADTIDDLTRRLERSGPGLRSAYKVRLMTAMDLGDHDDARTYHDLWDRSPRDWNTDCAACELDEEVRYRIFVGEDEEAVARAGPILAGRLRCQEVPHVTLGQVLMPLVRLGRVAEAVPHHLQGYRLISGNRAFLKEATRHLEFLVVTDNLARAVKLLEKHLPWALETFDLSQRFAFSLAARALLGRLQAQGKAALKLRVPESFPVPRAKAGHDLAALAAWFEGDAAGLARQFDERNGNDSFSRQVEASRRLADSIAPFPIAPPGRRKAGPGDG